MNRRRSVNFHESISRQSRGGRTKVRNLMLYRQTATSVNNARARAKRERRTSALLYTQRFRTLMHPLSLWVCAVYVCSYESCRIARVHKSQLGESGNLWVSPLYTYIYRMHRRVDRQDLRCQRTHVERRAFPLCALYPTYTLIHRGGTEFPIARRHLRGCVCTSTRASDSSSLSRGECVYAAAEAFLSLFISVRQAFSRALWFGIDIARVYVRSTGSCRFRFVRVCIAGKWSRRVYMYLEGHRDIFELFREKINPLTPGTPYF